MLDQRKQGAMRRSASHSGPPRRVLMLAAILGLCGMALLFSGALAMADDADPSTGSDRRRFGVAPQLEAASVVGDPAITDMVPGEQITIDVVVQNVVNLSGFQIQMSFDPSVVQIGDGDAGSPGVNVALGGFLHSPFAAQNIVSNTVGTIDVAVAQVGADPRTGDGALFSLIVQAVAPGDAGFVFDHVQLVDGNSLRITSTSTNPSVTVLALTATDTPTPTHTPTPESSYTPSSTPTPSATPSPTVTSTSMPEGPFFYLDPETTAIGIGETFDVMIKANSDGEDISGVEAHLQWDPSKLEVTQLVAGNTFQGYNTYTPLQNVNNTAGTLWYAHAMLEQFCVRGEWVVVTVTFRTLNYGVTGLSFGAQTMMSCSGLNVQPSWINGEVTVEQPGVTPSATPTASDTATPTEPPTGEGTPTPTPTVPTVVACTDVVENGDFEQVRAGWEWVSWAEASTRNPHWGAYSAYLAGYNGSDDAVLQSFALPSDAITATLSYWWYVETIESEHPYDYMYVELVHGGITTTLAVYSDGDVLDMWHQAGPFDLLAYAGETVQLLFRSVTDGKAFSSFFVDDVELDVCAPGSESDRWLVSIPLVLKSYTAPIPQ